MALKVVVVTVAIEVERQFCSLFGCHAAHVAYIFRLTAPGFFLTGGTSIGKPFLYIVDLRIKKTIAAHQSCIEHTECSNRLETFVCLRSFQRISATAANAEDSDSPCINSKVLGEDIGSTANVLNAVCRLVRIAGFSLARSLKGCIECKADIPLFGHPLAVKSCNLLFYTSIRVCDDKCRITF